MRHKRLNQRLGRFSSLRKATIRDIAKSVLIYQRISTSKPKAKQARRLVDRLITLGKENTLSARRAVFSILCDHNLVKLLFNDISPRFKQRMGGYTRILSFANRRGDDAHKVILELTEKKIKEKIKKEKPKKEEEKITTEPPLIKEPVKKEEKIITPHKKERPKIKEEKPSKKFLGGLRKFFKKERDSL